MAWTVQEFQNWWLEVSPGLYQDSCRMLVGRPDEPEAKQRIASDAAHAMAMVKAAAWKWISAPASPWDEPSEALLKKLRQFAHVAATRVWSDNGRDHDTLGNILDVSGTATRRLATNVVAMYDDHEVEKAIGEVLARLDPRHAAAVFLFRYCCKERESRGKKPDQLTHEALRAFHALWTKWRLLYGPERLPPDVFDDGGASPGQQEARPGPDTLPPGMLDGDEPSLHQGEAR